MSFRELQQQRVDDWVDKELEQLEEDFENGLLTAQELRRQRKEVLLQAREESNDN